MELYPPSPIRTGTTLPLQQSAVNTIVKKKRHCNQDITMHPVNRLHTACRIKRNPKIRNANEMKETYKKLPPLCKGYVQHLLISSAQGHKVTALLQFCCLPAVQVTIIDTPPPQKKQGIYRLGNSLFEDEALFHLSGYINTKNSTTWSVENPHTVQPGYKDIGLYDTPSITSDILCYQLIPDC